MLQIKIADLKVPWTIIQMKLNHGSISSNVETFLDCSDNVLPLLKSKGKSLYDHKHAWKSLDRASLTRSV